MNPYTRFFIVLTVATLVLLGAAPAALAAWNMTVSGAATTNVSVVGRTFTATGAGANVNSAELATATASGVTSVSAGSTGSETGDIAFATSLTLGANALELAPGASGSAISPLLATLDGTGALTVNGKLVARGDVRFAQGVTVLGATQTTAPALWVASTVGPVALQSLDSVASDLTVSGATVSLGGSAPIVGGSSLTVRAPSGITLNTPQLTGTNAIFEGPVSIPMDLTLAMTGELTFTGGAVTGVGSPDLTSTTGVDVNFPVHGSRGFGSVALSNAGSVTTLNGSLSASSDVVLSYLQLSGVVFITSGAAVTIDVTQAPGGRLYVNTSDATTFTGATSLDRLETNAGGTTSFATSPTASTSMSINDRLLLPTNVSLTSPTVELVGGIDGSGTGRVLNVDASTRAYVAGAVGSVTPLASINVTSATEIWLNVSSMSYTGVSSMNGPTRLVGNTNLGPSMQLNGWVSGRWAITGGDVTSSNLVGGGDDPASINVTGTWTMSRHVTTGGNFTASLVRVNGDSFVRSINGVITTTIEPVGASTPMIIGTASIAVPTGFGLRTSGLVTATGDITPTSLTVASGELRVPSGRSTGATSLTSGRTSGTGSLGATTMQSPASVEPGAAGGVGAIGTLNTGSISGDWNVGFEFDAATSDQLAVTGTVGISSGTPRLTELAPVAVGVERTIIANDGVDAVTGTFASHPEGTIVTMPSGAMYRLSYVGGTGNDVTLTRVVHATSTSISQSSATSNPGQSVTFTAAVSGGASGTPTGTVTFRDSGAAIGTVALISGQAQLSTTTLDSGAHSITATYNGDARFGVSASSAATHTVTTPTPTPPPADPTPTPPVDPTPISPIQIAPPALAMSDRCLVAGVDDPRIAFLLSRRARVTYSVQRRVVPAVPANQRGTCARQVSSSTSTVTPRYSVISSTTKVRSAGRVRTTLGTLLGERMLAPGVYRVVITIRAAGVRTRTSSMSFVVVERR